MKEKKSNIGSKVASFVTGVTLATAGAVGVGGMRVDDPRIAAYENAKTALITEIDNKEASTLEAKFLGKFLVIAKDQDLKKIKAEKKLKYSNKKISNQEAYMLSSIINEENGEDFKTLLQSEGKKLKEKKITSNQELIVAIELLNKQLKDKGGLKKKDVTLTKDDQLFTEKEIWEILQF